MNRDSNKQKSTLVLVAKIAMPLCGVGLLIYGFMLMRAAQISGHEVPLWPYILGLVCLSIYLLSIDTSNSKSKPHLEKKASSTTLLSLATASSVTNRVQDPMTKKENEKIQWIAILLHLLALVIFILSLVPIDNNLFSIILFVIAVTIWYSLSILPKLQIAFLPQYALSIDNSEAHVRIGCYTRSTAEGQSTGMLSGTTIHYKVHYNTFPLSVVRPIKGYETITIECNHCNVPLTIEVSSSSSVGGGIVSASMIVCCALYIFARVQFSEWFINTLHIDETLSYLGCYIAVFFGGVAYKVSFFEQYVVSIVKPIKYHKIFPL